jgi:hypothetical protein
MHGIAQLFTLLLSSTASLDLFYLSTTMLNPFFTSHVVTVSFLAVFRAHGVCLQRRPSPRFPGLSAIARPAAILDDADVSLLTVFRARSARYNFPNGASFSRRSAAAVIGPSFRAIVAIFHFDRSHHEMPFAMALESARLSPVLFLRRTKSSSSLFCFYGLGLVRNRRRHDCPQRPILTEFCSPKQELLLLNFRSVPTSQSHLWPNFGTSTLVDCAIFCGV